MNNIIMVGRLTDKIKIEKDEYKNKGIFTIAVVRPYKNLNGEYEIDFITCKCFGNAAKSLKEYGDKGDLIGVKGALQSEYDENTKEYKMIVFAEKITFLSQAKKGDE